MRAARLWPLRILEAGGVDHGEGEIADLRFAPPAVAGDARRVVDDGQALADQAVEQGRFADIGPADDGDGEGHDDACVPAPRLSAAPSDRALSERI